MHLPEWAFRCVPLFSVWPQAHTIECVPCITIMRITGLTEMRLNEYFFNNAVEKNNGLSRQPKHRQIKVKNVLFLQHVNPDQRGMGWLLAGERKLIIPLNIGRFRMVERYGILRMYCTMVGKNPLKRSQKPYNSRSNPTTVHPNTTKALPPRKNADPL